MANDFFDLQVNGYAGVDFNRDSIKVDDLHLACSKLKKSGVKGVLATIITANLNDMKKRMQQIVKLRRQDKLIEEMIYGIHIEGPFLNSEEGYRGAHPAKHICPANVKKMESLLDAADGLTRLVTLAPEVDANFNIIKMLHKNGIIISAGHTNASIDDMHGAINSGLSMFTHFGNGCPKFLNRHDNILQRVLSLKEHLWICFIADGIHIPFFSLKNYLNLTGAENSIIVTDAMAAADAPPGKYTLGYLKLEVGADRIVHEPGKPNFAGSATSMIQSKINLINKISLDEITVKKITSVNPMKAIGLDKN